MLIPSIDLQGGRIVQLVQGERLALATDDVDGWVARFRGRTAVQLIDLDAAKGAAPNDALVRRICSELPCRVGGGIRSIERAESTLALAATHVIVGSAFFAGGGVDLAFAERLASRIGGDRIIAAVDSRKGRVVIHGWRTTLDISPADAIRQLQPYVGGFLYTHVDREGLMRGTDLEAIGSLAAITHRRITAAGGITTMDEVRYLDAIGVDAVVGMALYTGTLALDAPD